MAMVARNELIGQLQREAGENQPQANARHQSVVAFFPFCVRGVLRCRSSALERGWPVPP